jgi:hypothetical protein
MTDPKPLSRRAQLLSEPVVLSSIVALARQIGVHDLEAREVTRATQRIAGKLLLRAEASQPTGSAVDAGEPRTPDRRDRIPDPPKGDIAFLCWLYSIAAHEAVRRARPSWVDVTGSTLDNALDEGPPPEARFCMGLLDGPGAQFTVGFDDVRLMTMAARAYDLLTRHDAATSRPAPAPSPPSRPKPSLADRQRGHTLQQVATAVAMVTLAILQHPGWLGL